MRGLIVAVVALVLVASLASAVSGGREKTFACSLVGAQTAGVASSEQFSVSRVEFVAVCPNLNPRIPSLLVDGVNTHGVPWSFNWEVGSVHNFTWADSVYLGEFENGKRCVWMSTAGLSTERSGSFTVPDGGGVINASYRFEYGLYVEVWKGEGNTSLGTGVVGGWVEAGENKTFSITALPAAGQAFAYWEHNYMAGNGTWIHEHLDSPVLSLSLEFRNKHLLYVSFEPGPWSWERLVWIVCGVLSPLPLIILWAVLKRAEGGRIRFGRRSLLWVPWLSVLVLEVEGVLHEFGHAAAALLSGFRVLGFGWFTVLRGQFVNYMQPSGVNAFVLFAGGFSDAVVCGVLLWGFARTRRVPLDDSDQLVVLGLVVFAFGGLFYGVFEAVTGV